MSKHGQRALFLGAGIHTCLGNGVEKNIRALQQPATPPGLHLNKITAEELQIPCKLLAQTPLEKPEERLYRAVNDVVEQALSEAQLTDAQRSTMGLFVGSSSFDISVWEAAYQRELMVSEDAVALAQTNIALLADYLVDELGIRGEDYSFNTACTASANALTAAVTQVESGALEYALVLGVELYNEVSALGFEGLGLLTRSVMKPFDAARDGLVLGEGISALVIGRRPDSDRAHFYLRGAANLSDCFSISAANPDGSSIAAVMNQALVAAGLRADQVDCLKVHGTASLSNDEAEAAGMHQVFEQLPALCAVKPYIGHTLGACGLNELILFYRAVEEGFLIANPGISAQPGELGVALNQQSMPIERGNFMLNYFGFGGNNTSLLISNLLQDK